MKEIFAIITTIPHFKRRFTVFVICVVLAQGVAIQVLPFVDRELTALVERGLNGESIPFQTIALPFVAALGAIILFTILNRISYTISGVFREQVYYQTFRRGFAKILRHDLEYITKYRSGSILKRIDRAANKFADLFTESAANLFRHFTKMLVAMAIIFTISWEIGLGILITFLLYNLIYWLRFRADIPFAEKRDTFEDKELSRVWEVVPQVQITKMYTNEASEENHVAWIGEEMSKLTRKRSRLWDKAAMAELPLVQAPTFLIKIWAAVFAIEGRYGLPTFVLMYALIESVQQPMWIINWFMWEMQDTYERAKKYLKIVRSREKIHEPTKPLTLNQPLGDLIFNQVSFSYKHGKQHVLRKIDLNFRQNQITALVGKSGAGKSTITNLICRFFDPSSGQITLGGVNIRQVTQLELRQHIGFVMQESFVFSGSVAENLRYAKKDASDKEIIKALQQAQAWDFVKSFKKGIQTQIGERGIKLSGGQKQRLSIARAVLKNPSILIMDEATNALDSESEVAVQKALDDFMKNRTVIIVAHRLSTIQKADMIYVVDDGKVQEAGNHEELLKQAGVYKMLFDIQSGGYEKQRKVMEEYEME